MPLFPALFAEVFGCCVMDDEKPRHSSRRRTRWTRPRRRACGSAWCRRRDAAAAEGPVRLHRGVRVLHTLLGFPEEIAALDNAANVRAALRATVDAVQAR
eukprot:EG_transcript_65277